MLNVALLGTGFGVDVYAQALRASNIFRLEVVFDADQSRAKDVKKVFGFSDYTTDWTRAIASKTVNLVIVATPNDTHFEIAKTAIEAGKHIIVSAPLTLSTAQAEELTSLANHAGVHAVVDHHYNYLPARRYTLSLLKSGKIGPVNAVERIYRTKNAFSSDFSENQQWKLQHNKGGGLFYATAPHDIDFLLRALGGVHKVSAQLQTSMKIRTGAKSFVNNSDDMFAMNFVFHNGTTLQYSASSVSPLRELDEFLFFGSNGILHLNNDSEVFFYHNDGAKERLAIPPSYHLTTVPGNRLCTPFFTFAETLASAIFNGTAISPTFDEAVHTQRILDAALISNEDKRWVEVGLQVKKEVTPVKTVQPVDKIF